MKLEHQQTFLTDITVKEDIKNLKKGSNEKMYIQKMVSPDNRVMVYPMSFSSKSKYSVLIEDEYERLIQVDFVYKKD